MTYSQGHSKFPRQACIAMSGTGDYSSSTRHLGHTFRRGGERHRRVKHTHTRQLDVMSPQTIFRSDARQRSQNKPFMVSAVMVDDQGQREEKWATAPSKIREISGEHPPVPNSSPSAWLVFDLLRGGWTLVAIGPVQASASISTHLALQLKF
jgi:hypothetical protein